MTAPLSEHVLPLTPAQLKAGRRVNAALALAPRLKTDGWRLAVGRRLNGVADRAVAPLGAAVLKRKGVAVTRETCEGCPVPMRIMAPPGRARALVVDFHGGGWVVGAAALNDRLTGHLAEDGFAVASVDYRLLDDRTPVWMPDAVADCAHALIWALDQGRRRFGVQHVFVKGESAGAHLAALALLALRDRGQLHDLSGAVFMQGVFDLSVTPSARAAGPETLLFDGPNLYRDLGRLVPDRDEEGRRAPDVSPLYADLTDVPPGLFVLGTADPFADDSRLMAQAWAAHAPTDLLTVPEAPHGFQHFGAPNAALTQAFVRDWLAKLAV